MVDLLGEGGLPAVQLRSVSERSGVALATIYRYFGSRDGLIIAAMTRFFDDEIRRPLPDRVRGDSMGDRLLSVYGHLMDVYEANPRMLGAWVYAMARQGRGGKDGLAARSQRAIVPLLSGALSGADEDYARDVIMVADSVWYAAVGKFVSGQLRLKEIYPRMERAVRLLTREPIPRRDSAR